MSVGLCMSVCTGMSVRKKNYLRNSKEEAEREVMVRRLWMSTLSILDFGLPVFAAPHVCDMTHSYV